MLSNNSNSTLSSSCWKVFVIYARGMIYLSCLIKYLISVKFNEFKFFRVYGYFFTKFLFFIIQHHFSMYFNWKTSIHLETAKMISGGIRELILSSVINSPIIRYLLNISPDWSVIYFYNFNKLLNKAFSFTLGKFVNRRIKLI